jgi:hypothetical protein
MSLLLFIQNKECRIIIIIILKFNLLTCKLNRPEANYRVSTSREEKTHTYKQNTKQGNNNNNSINTNKSEK